MPCLEAQSVLRMKQRPAITGARQAWLAGWVVRLWALNVGVAAMACQGGSPIIVGRDPLGPCATTALRREAQSWLQPLNASSPWLHPWKAYQDRWTGQRLRGAAGVRLSAAQTAALATLGPRLHAAGFTRVSMSVPWSSMRFDRPDLLADDASVFWRNALAVAKANGLRPTLHLGGDFDGALLRETLMLNLLQSAPAGATSVRLDEASVRRVLLGRTGLNEGGAAAAVLIIKVGPDGAAQLSRPLRAGYDAGPHAASTLRYPPFASPLLPNGQPNPTFEDTLAGYISFVKATSSLATSVLGDKGFDLVLWGAGWPSFFLSAQNYFDPFIEAGAERIGDLPVAILSRTAAALREARMHAFPLGDGFVDVTPTAVENASNEPAGSTAIVRKNRVRTLTLPSDWGDGSSPTLDANGQLDSTRDAAGVWVPNFLPSVRTLFPEQALTSLFEATLRPGQVIRDLSPIVTDLGSLGQHGRNVLNKGGQPVALWLDPAGLDLADSEANSMTEQQRQRLFAKAAMRTLTAFVSKGAAAVALAPFGMDHDIFFPQDDTGGLQTVGRFLKRFDGGAQGPDFWFTHVESCSGTRQFAGDGSAAHPDLLNRDVVMVAPFRVSPSRVVVAAYVMTYDLLAINTSPADDPRHFDLTPEPYQLSFVGQGAQMASLQVYDPLNDTSVPAQVIVRSGSRLTVEVPLTDSPRLITIEGL